MENNIDEIRSQYKIGSVQHRAINALAKHDLSTSEVKVAIGSKLPANDLRAHLKALVRSKVLLSVGEDSWSITTMGLNISVMLGPVPDGATRRRTNPDRICNGNAGGTYKGEELGHTCLRPGAYDAFLLPSIQGGRRHYPNGRKEVLA